MLHISSRRIDRHKDYCKGYPPANEEDETMNFVDILRLAIHQVSADLSACRIVDYSLKEKEFFLPLFTGRRLMIPRGFA